jgi:hypothetical protein
MVTLLYTLLNFNAEKDNKIHVWQRLFSELLFIMNYSLFFTCIRWKVKAPIPSVNKVINSLAHVCVYVCISDKLDSRSSPIVDLKLKLKNEFFLVSWIQLGVVSECANRGLPSCIPEATWYSNAQPHPQNHGTYQHAYSSMKVGHSFLDQIKKCQIHV